jgi:membrane protein implicated in regulation of membrane protease activity
MEWWIWILAGLALLGLEAATPGPFFFLFLGIAALVVGAVEGVTGLAGAAVALWVQLLLFSALAVTGLLAFRRRLVAAMAQRGARAEVDAIAGEEATLLEDMPPGGLGKAELRGAVWNVRNEGTGTLAKGTRCRVARVEGLTLVVTGQ